MEYPLNAICVSSVGTTWSDKPLDACGVYTITGGLAQHAYVAYVLDQPDLKVYLHITDKVFLSKDTVSDLYRRALKRGLFLPQTYFTEEYNALIIKKLRIAEDGLMFCFDTEAALEMAMYFDARPNGFKPGVCDKMRDAYLRYAEVLEQVALVFDQYKADYAKDLKDAH